MDLQERRQMEVARQVARVKARARPWRSIIILALALAALGLAVAVPFTGRGDAVHQAVSVAAPAAFCVLGLTAAVGLSGSLGNLLRPVLGHAHAAVIRYALVLLSGIAVLVVSLSLLRIHVGQLILGGAVTGVLIGIAGQQALANVFAGLVLLFARPFSIGDRVQIRSAALNGPLEGTVVEISITYVRLQTAAGVLHLPNSQVLAAAVGPAGTPATEAAASIPPDPPGPARPD